MYSFQSLARIEVEQAELPLMNPRRNLLRRKMQFFENVVS